MVIGQLQTRIGFSSERGKRHANEDFAVACAEEAPGRAVRDMVAVIADGLGGSPGGRLAAETSVRGFIDAYYSLPETLGIDRLAARALSAMNRWVHSQGRQNPDPNKMATTFSALILRGRNAYIVHVGDTRVYRLREHRLQRLTQDHVHTHPDLKHVLYRAVGLEADVRADYAVHALRQHDRFLLCSDGVHSVLSDERIRLILEERAAPEDGVQHLIESALQAGSQDNATALIVDVIDIPTADRTNLETTAASLPIRDLPETGHIIDGFRLAEIISDGRYSRLFRAEDAQEPREVILKFPHPRITTEENYRRAFVREAWVAAQVRNPWVTEVIELPPGRQTCLYSVMPFYSGENLERRLLRGPPVTLEEGVEIGIKLAKAVYALNRLRIIHRDIKPENVILTLGGRNREPGLKLLDLGVARLPEMDVSSGEEIPGTPSYMAPELFDGEHGDERSDLYALGVTLHRLFSAGHYPYGEIEAFSHPRFAKRTALSRYRPDLPAWLDVMLARATAANAQERFGDAMELAFELENGLVHGARAVRPRHSWYERNPVRFWQIVSILLFLSLLVALAAR
ncbi:MAG: protein kinase [Sulfuricaulis sp.]|nr:protein kinase [Sulfuricaulis sp.]